MYDPELLYISAVFHDLGLTRRYSSPDKRFEVDGANAARAFLKSHGVPEASLQLVWDAIALHTTIGVAEHKEAEVALLYAGVGLDVMGEGYEHLTTQNREEIIAVFPRNDFKKQIIPTFFSGFEHKTETTFGNIKADVCAHMIPGFQRTNFAIASCIPPGASKRTGIRKRKPGTCSDSDVHEYINQPAKWIPYIKTAHSPGLVCRTVNRLKSCCLHPRVQVIYIVYLDGQVRHCSTPSRLPWQTDLHVHAIIRTIRPDPAMIH